MTRKSLIPIALVLLVFAASLAFGLEPKDPAKRNISFPGPDGTTLSGYIAMPAGSGPFPAVLMIHEWWGLNHDTALLADALSEEGFVVLAADAFRGSVAVTVQDARSQVQNTPRDQFAADLDASLEFLRAHPKVEAEKVAALGFCFGGTQSMYMGTRNPELSGVVIFYGGGPITSVQQLGQMRSAGPVLGIYGEEDRGIPQDQVKAFEAALETENVEHTIEVYPGVGHAFVKSDTYNAGGTAQRAWMRMVDFLKQNLK